MAKRKEPIYPTDEWVEKWIDAYLDKATEKVTDFDSIREKAMEAWWMNEIEHDRATPFDLTEEEEAESKKARKGMARAVNAYGKEVKRERKADEEKRKIIEILEKALTESGFCAIISNVERQIDFGEYSVTLTKHRTKKE